MRCSLLTLSSYLDRELPPDRAGELEAHLIACPRCSTGLGYLREEAERIRGLSVARVPVHATEQVLVTVGLAEPRTHVAAAPPTEMPAHFEPSFDFSPGLIGSAYGPATAEPVAPGIDDYAATPDVETHEPDLVDAVEEAEVAPATDEPDQHEEAAQHDEAARHDAAHDVVEVAGTSQRLPSQNYWGGALVPPEPSPPEIAPPEPEPPQIEPPDMMAPELTPPELAAAAQVPPDVAMPPSPPPIAVPHGGRTSSMFDRLRDAIALRLALMRSSHVNELDDSVQIVSGAGAPDWTAHRSQRDRHERMAASYRMPAEPEAMHETAPPHDVAMPYDINTVPFDVEQVEDMAPVPAAHSITMQPEPEVPGRHTRALRHGRAALRSWPRLSDPRLGAFGAAVLVLLVIGLLVGKHSVPLPAGNHARAIPNPTAIANVPPNVVATPAVTPQATPAPTPGPRRRGAAARTSGCATACTRATSASSSTSPARAPPRPRWSPASAARRRSTWSSPERQRAGRPRPCRRAVS